MFTFVGASRGHLCDSTTFLYAQATTRTITSHMLIMMMMIIIISILDYNNNKVVMHRILHPGSPRTKDSSSLGARRKLKQDNKYRAAAGVLDCAFFTSSSLTAGTYSPAACLPLITQINTTSPRTTVATYTLH